MEIDDSKIFLTILKKFLFGHFFKYLIQFYEFTSQNKISKTANRKFGLD